MTDGGPLDTSLTTTLGQVSPRLNPPVRRLTGLAIWLGAVGLFVALFAQAFVQKGVGAWAVGIVYILYDTALVIFVARRTGALARDIPKDAHPIEAGSVGVIIAAYNEAPVLEATIEALRRQDPAPDRIVIADDGSNDGTAAVLLQIYGIHPPALGTMSEASALAPELGWLRLPHAGKAYALNAAIMTIGTDIVVTVDADTLLDHGSLAAMTDAFGAEPELVAATGVLRPICDETVTGRVFQWFQTYEYVRNFLSRYAWMGSNSLLLISGAFAGYRRSALLSVGGFDAACLVEDYEVIHRLHRFSADNELDWRVRVIGGARASTDSPGRLLPFLRQRRRWFAGFLQTQFWNRDMIGNRRYHALGTAMLPVKTLDTVQPFYGLSAFALLIVFLATGSFKVVLPIFVAMAAKIVIDLAYLIWSIRIYGVWAGQRLSISGAVLAAIVEPLSFQLLRHAGAAWGWWVFVTGRQTWTSAARGGILARLPAEHERSVDSGSIA